MLTVSSFHITVFLLLHSFIRLTITLHGFGAACFEKQTREQCTQFAACKWEQTKCKCGSLVPSDIMFIVDTSDSLTLDEFKAERIFVRSIVENSVPVSESRIGLIDFFTRIQTATIPNQFNNPNNNPQANISAISHLIQTRLHKPAGGRTNITGALDVALQFFETQSPASLDRYKTVILLTDGAHSVDNNDPCQTNRLRDAYRAADIRVIFVQVGALLKPSSVNCLLADVTRDTLRVEGVVTEISLATVRRRVEEATCPDNFRVTITEVSPSSSSQVGFIEMFNHANLKAPVTSLAFSGLARGDLSDLDVTWAAEGYLVIFDLDDIPNIPRCTFCSCLKRSDPTISEWCQKSTYVGCTAKGRSSVSTALKNSMGISYISERCNFSRSYTLTNWEVSVLDTGNGATPVVLDSTKYSQGFPTVRDYYTYELKHLGLDNNNGSNWRESCGSPGHNNASCTISPTKNPTKNPTATPSMNPVSTAPSPSPSKNPTAFPTKHPTTTLSPSAYPTRHPISPTRAPTYDEYNVTSCLMQIRADGSGVRLFWNTNEHSTDQGRHPSVNNIKHDVTYRALNGSILTTTIDASPDNHVKEFSVPAETGTARPFMRTYYITTTYSTVINCSVQLEQKGRFNFPLLPADDFVQWFPWAMWAMFVAFIGGAWVAHRAYANSKMKAQADEDQSSGCC